MKFVKGMILGTIVSAGVVMMYKEGMMNRNKVMKKGRQFAKKIGVL